MARTLSISGGAPPGLISVAKLHAPPYLPGSSSQYTGGTKSYGPFIFTPEGPLNGEGVADADET